LPPVRADATALELLLNNLIDNAIRYSSEIRELTITARAEGARVALRVTDRGRGIEREELEHVTKRFYRGRRRAASGSGLGLAIVDRIVKDHGGTLEIASTPGQGTTVTVSLPAAS
jgi:two-component system phosphate regulon sensor histidine kinase PhoR